jgi:hypothetical protein
MEQSPSWEASQEIPRFYGTRKFITIFTTARRWSLSWARWIQSKSSHPSSLKCILILSSHLRQGLLHMSSFQVLRRKFCTNFSSLHACYMPRPYHPPRLDHPNDTKWNVQVMKLVIMQPFKIKQTWKTLPVCFQSVFRVLRGWWWLRYWHVHYLWFLYGWGCHVLYHFFS